MKTAPSIVTRPGRSPWLWSIVAVGLAPAPAWAGLEGRPVPVLEAGCQLEVQIDGPIARVREIHHVVSEPAGFSRSGPAGHAPVSNATQATYRFQIAAGGLIDGFEVAPAGRPAGDGILVPAASLSSVTPGVLALPPDLGLLRVVPGGPDDPTFEARLFPVEPGKAASFTVRWSAPMTYTGGRLTLRIPARGARTDTNLSRCAVRVVARPASGVRSWAAVFAAGVHLGAGAQVRGATSATPVEPLVIEATPRWHSAEPVLAVAPIGVGDGQAIAVGVFVPDQATEPTLAPERLLLVVDTSHSMGAAGRAAAVRLVDELVRAVPVGTPVEVVLFDRVARRVLGQWAPSNPDRGSFLAAAVAAAPATSGSDLPRALRLAADALGDEPGRVVLITDAIVPTNLVTATLMGHFPVAAERVVLDAIVPVIPGAALPGPGPLDAFAGAYHGRVAPVRTQDLPTSAGLVRLLAAGPPLDEPVIAGDGPDLEVALPDRLEPGAGAWRFVTDVPGTRLTLRGTRVGKPLQVRALGLPRGAARFAVHAKLMNHPPDLAAAFALARQHRVLTDATALVIADVRGPASRERAAVARRTGLYSRTAPPDDPPIDTLVPAPRVATGHATAVGVLPRESVALAVRDQLMPRLEVCYRALLRSAPAGGGTMHLALEVARGEVMDVRLAGDHFPAAMVECAADAAFAVETPAYQLGEQPDTIYLVRKSVTFRPPATTGGAGLVQDLAPTRPPVNPAAAPAIDVDTDAPL